MVMVTGADSGYMHLLKGVIESFRRDPRSAEFDIRCMDLGLNKADRDWLAGHEVETFEAYWPMPVRDGQFPYKDLGFAGRAFIREYLPGWEMYLWLDSDLWIQDWDTIPRYIEGARSTGLAIAKESHAGYRLQIWLQRWMLKHWVLGYGIADGLWLMSRPHLNVGLWALAGDAPHWEAWQHHFRQAYDRSGFIIPHDQFGLNRAVYGSLRDRTALPVTVLPAGCNWICDRGIPMWNDEAQAFCEPVPPFSPIGVLHLAGPAKRTDYDIRRTAGGSFKARITYGAAPAV